MYLAGGDLRICQTSIHQDRHIKVCIFSNVGALHWSTSPLRFSVVLSLPRKSETNVCTHLCGLSVYCGSWDTGQRALLCALHRALLLVRLALVPLALLPDLFIGIAQEWHFHWKQRAQGVNIHQMRPRSYFHLLPLCSRWTSSFLTSSLAPVCGMVHACHPKTRETRMRSQPWLPPSCRGS